MEGPLDTRTAADETEPASAIADLRGVPLGEPADHGADLATRAAVNRVLDLASAGLLTAAAFNASI